jgi:hypothetical protein
LIILNISFSRYFISFVKLLIQFIFIFLNLLFADNAFFQQLFGIDLINIGKTVNFLIHQRLGKQRLIQLIMAIFPIAYNINDDIFVEHLPVFQTHPDDLVDHNWVVGIDVENGSHYGFGHFRAVET